MTIRNTQTQSQLASIVDDGEKLSTGELVAYSLIATTTVPFATSGVGALLNQMYECDWEQGAVKGLVLGGLISGLTVYRLARRFIRERR